MTRPLPLSVLQEQAQEWEAWQVIVHEWDEAIDTTMNDPKYDKLIAAINLWGEYLVGLRLTQTDEMRNGAIAAKQQHYDNK